MRNTPRKSEKFGKDVECCTDAKMHRVALLVTVNCSELLRVIFLLNVTDINIEDVWSIYRRVCVGPLNIEQENRAIELAPGNQPHELSSRIVMNNESQYLMSTFYAENVQ